MRRRQGFTLVELMVSMALIIFIMTILSQAFVTATQTFRDLRAAGELARSLSGATALLRADLSANHFQGDLKLSSPYFWNNGPPDMGFVRIYQGSPSAPEGVDSDGIPSFRSVNHMLAMTLKARGNLRSNFYSTVLPNLPNFGQLLGPFNGGDSRYQPDTTNGYNFQWAEVTWFLYPSINPTTGQQDTANGTKLYTLYRRVRLPVPDNSLVNPPLLATSLSQFPGMSCQVDPSNSANLYFNSPVDLTIPGRRFGMNTAGFPVTNVPGFGYAYLPLANTPGASIDDKAADAILLDVVSFDVRVLLAGAPDYADIQAVAAAFPNGNPLFSATNGWVFDTWSKIPGGTNPFPPDYSQWNVAGQQTSLPTWNSATNTGPIITAVKITLRVWDPNTNLTRQVTIVAAM
jgi:prepilin-type N-terminal cleavage/methylation domain-containing protein